MTAHRPSHYAQIWGARESAPRPELPSMDWGGNNDRSKTCKDCGAEIDQGARTRRIWCKACMSKRKVTMMAQWRKDHKQILSRRRVAGESPASGNATPAPGSFENETA